MLKDKDFDIVYFSEYLKNCPISIKVIYENINIGKFQKQKIS